MPPASPPSPPSPAQPDSCYRQIVTEDDVYTSESSVHSNNGGTVSCWWLNRGDIEAAGGSCADYIQVSETGIDTPCMDYASLTTRCTTDKDNQVDCTFSPAPPPTPPTSPPPPAEESSVSWPLVRKSRAERLARSKRPQNWRVR